MRYEAVIFDLDGTLINSLEDLADSANLMLESYGFPMHEVEKYRYFVGNGSRKLIERILPEERASSPSFVDEALAKYKGIYAEHVLEKTRAYKGIREMLEKLRQKGIPMGVCTNKHMDAAKTIVRFLFEPDTFRQVVGDRPGYQRKPNPANVLQMAKAFGVAPEKVAYLGDTSVDMQTAKNAGFLPVGVLWGFRGKEELLESGAAILLEQPMDLLKKIDFA